MKDKVIINKILSILNREKIATEINNHSFRFHDEPKFYLYHVTLYCADHFLKNKYTIPNDVFVGTGLSFKSAYHAMLKSVSESIERLSLTCYQENKIIYHDFVGLKNKNLNLLDPFLYKHNTKIRKVHFGWISGYNLTVNKNSLIPAQLTYLNYYQHHNEPQLTSFISTGAAAGFSKDTVVITGIYEVVERDAVMTIYLNKVPLAPISYESIPYKSSQYLIEICLRYKIKIFLFDATTDIQIPVFLAILVDETDIGPSIVVGSKANFDVEKAINGSIEEALMTRTGLRRKIIENKSNKFTIKRNEITTLEKRCLFWSSPFKKSKLDFLLKNKPTHLNRKSQVSESNRLLQKAIDSLSKKRLDVFVADITMNNLSKTNLIVHKVIIPGLQPLYLNQTKQILKRDRLREVANYFGIKKFKINTYPHPFL